MYFLLIKLPLLLLGLVLLTPAGLVTLPFLLVGWVLAWLVWRALKPKPSAYFVMSRGRRAEYRQVAAVLALSVGRTDWWKP
jgi:hypothetical protein